MTFSPNGKFVVSTMQENAVHGWRLSDNADFSMSPYPAKIKSIAWAGNTPYLVTSGASEAVCWPFKGKDGPMGKGPICVAGRKQIVSCVQGFPDVNGVLAGFHDGTVVLSQIKPESDAVVLRNATGVEVTAIAVTETGSHLLIGDATLWFKMQDTCWPFFKKNQDTIGLIILKDFCKKSVADIRTRLGDVEQNV